MDILRYLDSTSELPLNVIQQFFHDVYVQSNIRKSSEPVYITRLSPEYLLGLKLALLDKVLDPNASLVTLLNYGRDEHDLLALAMCMRYGANMNAYVNDPIISARIHILAYAYEKLRSLRLFDTSTRNGYPDTLLAMMILAGSDLNKPAFEQKGSSVQRYITVSKWLQEQGYSLAGKYTEEGISNVVDASSRRLIYILLDRTDDFGRIDSKDLISRLNLHIIKSLGDSLVSELTPTPDSVYWDNLDLLSCIEYMNIPCFTRVLESGLGSVKYPTLNDMLVRARYFKKRGLVYAEKTMMQLIQIAVKYGLEIDVDQKAMLATLDPLEFSKINEAYSVPYWKKVCSIAGKEHSKYVPVKLQRLALELNIPIMDKARICLRLTDMAKRHGEELKEAAVNRVINKLGSDLGHIEEFIGGKAPILIPENSRTMTRNFHELADVDVSYYRDLNGKIWVFTSEEYPSILESKVNFHNHEPLPLDFLSEVAFKVNLLKQVGVLGLPQSVPQAIDSLRSPDVLGGTSGLHSLQVIIESTGIPSVKYMKLTSRQIYEQLNALKIRNDVIALTDSHARITLGWILSWLNNEDPKVYALLVHRLHSA